MFKTSALVFCGLVTGNVTHHLLTGSPNSKVIEHSFFEFVAIYTQALALFIKEERA